MAAWWKGNPRRMGQQLLELFNTPGLHEDNPVNESILPLTTSRKSSPCVKGLGGLAQQQKKWVNTSAN